MFWTNHASDHCARTLTFLLWFFKYSSTVLIFTRSSDLYSTFYWLVILIASVQQYSTYRNSSLPTWINYLEATNVSVVEPKVSVLTQRNSFIEEQHSARQCGNASIAMGWFCDLEKKRVKKYVKIWIRVAHDDYGFMELYSIIAYSTHTDKIPATVQEGS